MTAYSRRSLARTSYLAGICALAALVVFTGIPRSTQFMHVLHKTGHPLAFGAIAVLTLMFLLDAAPDKAALRSRSYAIALSVAVGFGVLTEVAQLFTNRGSSAMDVLSDAVGATAALGIFSSISRTRGISEGRLTRMAALSVGVAAACVALAPLAWCAAAYVNREARFPIVARMDSPLDEYFVSETNNNVMTAPVPARWARNAGEKAWVVSFDKGNSAGVQVTEPHPDWRDRQTLKLEVTNVGASDLPVTIRIHDRQHNWLYQDRFNRAVTLKALTRQTIRIPIADIARGPQHRMLDLSHVANLAVFVWQPQSNGQFLLHSVILE